MSSFKYAYKSGIGLSEKLIKEISNQKGEPRWMLEKRVEALRIYYELPLPKWGVNLNNVNFNDIYYYLRPINEQKKSWKDVPREVRDTFEKIGVPKAEREILSGVKAQFDSEVVYGSLKKSLREKGIVFLSMDEGLREYPDLVKKHFGTVVPPGDNKLAALNSAVWSGGSFIYIPKGIEVGLPLQAYFRINSEKAGQFERTLIVADEGSKLHYVEGCSAPVFTTGSLHAAVVEVVLEKDAKVTYTTIQNWYKNVYNLVTKRAYVKERGEMRWIDGNLGSRVTMKYPSCVLAGKGAKGEMLSIAWAGSGQQLDTGAKMIHLASGTSSRIVSKSASKNGGRSSYRGLVHIAKGAVGAKSKVECDALILDSESRSDTYPTNRVFEETASLEHEATVGKIGEEQLLYLMNRGMNQEEAEAMIVNGFLEPIMKQIPLEYAIEMNRLIEMEMEGSVG